MSTKIMFLWGSIIVLICASLIVISNLKQDRILVKLERNLKLSSYKYFKENDLIPSFNESNVVNINELIENKYIEEDENIDKYCIKQVKVTNKFIIDKYEVIRKCDEVLKEVE